MEGGGGGGGGGGQEGPPCDNIILSGSKMCGIPVRCAFKLYKQ